MSTRLDLISGSHPQKGPLVHPSIPIGSATARHNNRIPHLAHRRQALPRFLLHIKSDDSPTSIERSPLVQHRETGSSSSALSACIRDFPVLPVNAETCRGRCISPQCIHPHSLFRPLHRQTGCHMSDSYTGPQTSFRPLFCTTASTYPLWMHYKAFVAVLTSKLNLVNTSHYTPGEC